MKPIEIAPGIYDVGINDWNISDFHGYSTPFGTSYNAYLVLDEKIALIDTVKSGFADELFFNISKVVDPKKIDLVISNHTEMDHSGSLARVMHRIGEDKPLYCSKMGEKNLQRHLHRKLNYQPVANGQELTTGRRSFTFLETRMVHWPDSMFTYLKEDRILFSSDGFGQHYAGFDKFDDQAGSEAMAQAKKYYANILYLYSPLVKKLLVAIEEMNLNIKMIAPDHGVIWRSEIPKIIDKYKKWSSGYAEKEALVIYDTMWNSTEKMGLAIAQGLDEEGIKTKVLNLRYTHYSDVITDVLEAKAVILGSSTLNNGMLPRMVSFIMYMKGLKPLNKIGASFGSFGWSGEAVKMMNEIMESLHFDIIDDGLRFKYIPVEEQLAQCVELGKKIGQAVNQSA